MSRQGDSRYSGHNSRGTDAGKCAGGNVEPDLVQGIGSASNTNPGNGGGYDPGGSGAAEDDADNLTSEDGVVGT